jgi:hypothetical protein
MKKTYSYHGVMVAVPRDPTEKASLYSYSLLRMKGIEQISEVWWF